MDTVKITDYQSVEDDYRAIRELHAIEEKEQAEPVASTEGMSYEERVEHYMGLGTHIYDDYKFNSSI